MQFKQPVFVAGGVKPTQRFWRAYRTCNRIVAQRQPGVCTVYTGEQAQQRVAQTQQPAPQAVQEQPVAKAEVSNTQQHAVVNNAFALALRGSKHFGNANATMYGVFNTEVAAQSYIAQRGLRLVATVVTL